LTEESAVLGLSSDIFPRSSLVHPRRADSSTFTCGLVMPLILQSTLRLNRCVVGVTGLAFGKIPVDELYQCYR
jgi:hypothetical protein